MATFYSPWRLTHDIKIKDFMVLHAMNSCLAPPCGEVRVAPRNFFARFFFFFFLHLFYPLVRILILNCIITRFESVID